MCLLTHAVWPYGYGPVVHDGHGVAVLIVVLVVRNLLLVALTATAFRQALRATRRTPKRPISDA